MSRRLKTGGALEFNDDDGDDKDDDDTKGSIGANGFTWVALVLVSIVLGALYVERNVLCEGTSLCGGQTSHASSVGGLVPEKTIGGEIGTPPQIKPSHDLEEHFFTVENGFGRTVARQLKQPQMLPKYPPGIEEPTQERFIEPFQKNLLRSREEAPTHSKIQAEYSLDDMNIEKLEALVEKLTLAVKKMKFENKLVMERDSEAIAAIAELQEACRVLVPRKYGPEPYFLEMKLRFPRSMPDFASEGESGTVRIEMAPLEFMPYAVLTFLDMITKEFKGGSFMRNAPHVKQASLSGKHPGFPLVFQEYHPKFPHIKYSLGFAGRPSSSQFYISTVDNVRNHGPGSQGSATEADACFAKLVGAEAKSGPSVEVVKRLAKQPGGKKPNGFVESASDFVIIESFKFLKI